MTKMIFREVIYLQLVLAALAPSVADLQRRKGASGHQDRRNLVKSAGPARFCGDPPAVIVVGIKVIGRSDVDPGQDRAVEQRREAREDEQEVEDHGGSAHDGGDLLVGLGNDTGDKIRSTRSGLRSSRSIAPGWHTPS